MAEIKERVVVVGASPKVERYSNKAMRLLAEHGHEVVPIHPAIEEIDGIAVAASLADVAGEVDTVTMYVSPKHSGAMAAGLIALKPKRVIFNPGTENAALAEELEQKGIATEEACTLILLNTGQF